MIATSSRPPPTASQPSSGWKVKIAKMKIGVQGMSKSAKSTGEAMKRCTASRSRRPDQGRPRSPETSARERPASKTLRVEPGLDQRADPGGDAAAGVVEHAHDAVERRDQHGERDERRLGAARQHPVVDLEHVERPGQHQDVDEAAEHPERHEQRPRAAQRGLGGGLGHGLQGSKLPSRGATSNPDCETESKYTQNLVTIQCDRRRKASDQHDACGIQSSRVLWRRDRSTIE